MKKATHNISGFTLIELLVVIAILALLASLVVPAVGRALASAKVTQAISGIRQSGMFVLAEATENQGKIGMQIFGSSSGMQDYRLEGIVSKHLGDVQKDNAQLSRIIRTPAWYNHPTGGQLSTWNVWGVNYEDNSENGVFWKRESVPGYEQNVAFLYTSGVMNPTNYALLGDSSNDKGAPHLRLSRVNGSGYSFALRYNKRGPIFTLDGSAKMIGRDQMERYGFRRGYLFKTDNPATDPEFIKGY